MALSEPEQLVVDVHLDVKTRRRKGSREVESARGEGWRE
jgi:hypothetical protein